MGVSEIKEFLKNYRMKGSTRSDLKNMWELVLDNHNEKVIKEFLLEELNGFEVKESEATRMDFEGIYSKIASGIKLDKKEPEAKANFLGRSKRPVFQILKIAALFVFIFSAGGLLSYVVFNRPEKPTAIAYNEISAPLGARSEVVLPDGSRVWLNAGSKIKYLDAFNRVNRNVLLEGEAYFKVAKNDKLPFNVKTKDLSIIAVGTEFNVKAYDDEGIIETTLVEGKVSIMHNHLSRKQSQLVMLEPHQKAVYVKEDQHLTVEDLKAIRQTKPEILQLKQGTVYVSAEVDPLPIIAWKDNKLIFKGEELSSLLTKLERKYDVTFLYESENIKQFHFTGTLEDETLTQVLDVIKLSAPIDYMLEGKQVNISVNKQMLQKFSGHLKKK
jgi:ferric-dicitrate binding protein FerR (iron transport regulator)